MQRQLVAPPELRQALSLEELQALQRAVFEVYVDPALVSYAVAHRDATREPADARARRARGLHRVRREPARADQPRAGCPRARARARPRLRARRGPAGARQGRAAPPARAHLPGARRGGDAGHDPRRACSRRCPCRRSTSPGTTRRVSRCARSAREPTPARPGPGPMPERCCARSTSRSAAGSTACSRATTARRCSATGTELAQVRPYVPGRRRAPDRLERHRAHRRAARPRPPRRARARHVARAGHVAVDAASAPPTGARRTSPRASRSRSATSRRGAATGSASSPSATTSRDARRRGRAGVGLLGLLARARGDEPECAGTPARRRSARRCAAPARSRASARSSSSSRDFRGPRDWRRPLLELAGRHDVRRGRDPRPARAGAPERGRALARRPGDGPAAPRRHAQREAARALRRGRRGGARAELARTFASAGVRHVVLSTAGDWLRPLAGFLRKAQAGELPVAALRCRCSSLVPLLVGALRGPRAPPAAATRRASRNPALLPNVVDRAPGWRRHLRVALLLAALAAMIVGVARPHATVSVPREEATVILAIDVSRSMGATDVAPTRLRRRAGARRTRSSKVPKSSGSASIGVRGRALPRDPADARP